jgi:hypothetical protein
MTREENLLVRLSGASVLCWSLFDIYALRDALKGNLEGQQDSSLTWGGKFDTFEKFAQKCWRTYSTAFSGICRPVAATRECDRLKNQQRIKFRGQPDLRVWTSIPELRSGGRS